MSVLIKGMEMPKDGCHHMICIYADGTVSTGGRVYMAVSIPPHGRVIDADALYTVMKKERDRIARDYGDNDEYVQCLTKYAISMVHCAPTIIPADGDKDTNVPTKEEEE